MNIVQCDGKDCKKQSPDPKTGLYEANSWYTVKIKHKSYDSEIILCEDCFKTTGLRNEKN